MKKIFMIVCAVLLAMGVNATSQDLSSNYQSVNGLKLAQSQKFEATGMNVAANDVLLNASAALMQKAPAMTEEELTPTIATANYCGTFRQFNITEFAENEYILLLQTADDKGNATDVAQIGFCVQDKRRIAGKYTSLIAEDTKVGSVSVTGSVELTYLGTLEYENAGQKYYFPKYQINASLSGSGKQYTMNCPILVEAYDYCHVYYCNQGQQYEDAQGNHIDPCGMTDITLEEAKAPTGEKVNIAISGAQYVDKTASESFYRVLGQNNEYEVFLDVTAKSFVGTVKGADACQYSIITRFSDNKELSLADGTVTVAQSGSEYTITAQLFDTEGVEYDVTMQTGGSTPTPPSSNFDLDQNMAFTATFNNVLWTTNTFAQQGSVFLDADGDADATKGISLCFFPTAIDPATTVPVGNYPISSEFTTGTAAASQGFDGVNYWQCMAYTSLDGMSFDKLWFITSGSINVTKNLKGVVTIIVNGKNSKGQNVNVTIMEGSTPIDNVEAEKVASKRIENGQVIIRRNGVDYNMMGTAF